MVYYADTASGGPALGSLETGGVAWAVVGTGTWTKASGKFSNTTLANGNFIHPVTSPTYADLDLKASLREASDALYFRASNQTNWLRVRTEAGVRQYNPHSPEYPNGNPAITVHERVIQLVLDQSVNGTITTIAKYVVYNQWSHSGYPTEKGPFSVRVVARKSSVEVYLGTNKVITQTITQHQNNTLHGIGRTASYSPVYHDDTYTAVTYSTSSLDDFELTTLEPIIPTVFSPTEFAVLNSNTPGLQGSVSPAYGYSQRIEYQIASNSSFTTGLRTIQEPTSSLRTSGTVITTVPTAQALTQTTWFLRARTINEFGDLSAWTATVQFSVSHQPTTMGHTPTGGSGILTGVNTRFAWVFSDTSAVDTQTAYQLIIERNDNGTQVLDTGKVLTSSGFTDRNISATYNDIELRWRVRVWDNEDVVGPYSSYNIIKPSTAPVVSIVTPSNGSTVISGNPLVDWNFAATAGRTQSQYKVVVYNNTTSQTILDTGFVNSNVTQYQLANILRNGNSYTVTVTAVDNTGLVGTATVTVPVSYTTPTAPQTTVDASLYADSGYVAISWPGQPVDSNFVEWRVYRTDIATSVTSLIYSTADPNIRSYDDYMAPSQATLEYQVVQVVNQFGENVESFSNVPPQVALPSGGYWLIDPNNSANNLLLYNVTGDSYTNTRERQELVVVGRGRHVDLGQRVGIAGTMDCRIRTSSTGTARAKKIALEQLADQGLALYLRNPFGDIWLVSIGDPQVTRVAGVGPSEFVDVSIPYVEVY